MMLKITTFRKFFDLILKNLQNFAIKENGSRKSLFVLFETFVLCSHPEWASIKQVVLV